MSKIIKPARFGIPLLYYCAICSIAAALATIQSKYFFNLESARINSLVSVLCGASVGLLLLSPLILAIKKINFSIANSIFKKSGFIPKALFPLELTQLSDEVSDIYKKAIFSNEELSRQDTARRELLANAAHDIKGPLSAISGYLEDCLSRLESGDIDATKKSLEVCSKNTALLEGIVLQIFEAAKFDNLNGNLVLEVIAIDELLSDIVQKFKPKAAKEFKMLDFKPGTNNALVQVDIGLFERAISNLIDNAFKYTDIEGNISLGSKIEADHVLLYVSDNGKGIPEKDLPHIFDRLYRVERDRSKEAKGSGFGLSIVKNIIEAHAGKIMCSSTVAAGTVFQMTIPVLPKEKVAEAMAELISKRQ